MSSYQIREAQPGDLESIYEAFSLVDALHRQAHPEIFQIATGDEIKNYLLEGILSDEAVVFVAELENSIIGALIAWVWHAPDNPLLVKRKYLSIENLVVTSEFRRQGVGQALMRRVEDWAREHCLTHLQLTVWDFNRPALAFYEQLGYEMLHHRMRKELR